MYGLSPHTLAYTHTCVLVHRMPSTFTVGTQPCILPQLNLPTLTTPGGPTPRPQAPGMLFWKLGGVPRQAGLWGASWSLEASCVSAGVASAGQGRAGQPHLASVALEPGWASVGQEQGGGCCPLLHLILAGQPGVPERPGPLSTSPWGRSSCVHRFQSWGWAAHIRCSGLHLCPELCSL